jgi:Lar family restriction alleviation protein
MSNSPEKTIEELRALVLHYMQRESAIVMGTPMESGEYPHLGICSSLSSKPLDECHMCCPQSTKTARLESSKVRSALAGLRGQLYAFLSGGAGVNSLHAALARYAFANLVEGGSTLDERFGQSVVVEVEVMSSTHIDSCPHCGGKGIVEKTLRAGHKPEESDAWAYYVICSSCAATGPWSKSGSSGAISQWNRRITPGAN